MASWQNSLFHQKLELAFDMFLSLSSFLIHMRWNKVTKSSSQLVHHCSYLNSRVDRTDKTFKLWPLHSQILHTWNTILWPFSTLQNLRKYIWSINQDTENFFQITLNKDFKLYKRLEIIKETLEFKEIRQNSTRLLQPSSFMLWHFHLHWLWLVGIYF